MFVTSKCQNIVERYSILYILFFCNAGAMTDYLIFATDDNLRTLCNANLVSMDGTFDVTPLLFRQLFTLHAFEDDRLLPLVYVLMATKTAAMYSDVLSDIKNECLRVST